MNGTSSEVIAYILQVTLVQHFSPVVNHGSVDRPLSRIEDLPFFVD